MFMNKLKNYVIALTFVALLGLGACKPEKPKDPITITYKLGEVADYMVFKQGTYWVYENDVTGEIDSQWVTSCQVGQYTQKGTEAYSSHITLIQDFFEMNIATNFIDGYGNNPRWKVSSWGNRVNAYPEPKRAYQVDKTKKAINTGGTSTVYYHSYNLCPNKDCWYFYDTLLTKYELNGAVYDTVRVFRVGADWAFQESRIPSLSGGLSDYYYAKNVGLIKLYNKNYRLSDGVPLNQTWSLIRKKIIQ
jgi:hypothetical protein